MWLNKVQIFGKSLSPLLWSTEQTFSRTRDDVYKQTKLLEAFDSEVERVSQQWCRDVREDKGSC